MSGDFDTPVAVSVYSRAHFVRCLVDALRPIRPRRLLVFADGANPERSGDERRCAEARAVIEAIEWPCDVEWNLAAANLGARKRIQSGLSWVFDRVDEAIVFEEDCIPHPTFLPFCRELLARYREDPRVLIISGMVGPSSQPPGGSESYEFSIHPNLYGWAAWRRTWELYEPNVDSWPALRGTPWLTSIVGDVDRERQWATRFDLVRKGLDTWDHSLVFSCWKARGLSIRPRHDLVENVGFGPDGTHTLDATSELAARRARPVAFPLVHPSRVEDWEVLRERAWAALRSRQAPGHARRRRDEEITVETLPPFGTSLDLTDDAVAPALVDGWSFRERGGRWTDGTEARVAWRVDRPPDDDLRCAVQATPAVCPAQPQMTIDVLVNDAHCATVDADGAALEFTIPRTLVHDRPRFVLTFRVRRPLVPAEHQTSDDFRALGLFVRSIRFQ